MVFLWFWRLNRAWRHHHAETFHARGVPHGRVGVAGKLGPGWDGVKK